ncbi:MAG TPA: lipopolysaccharide biosynthesis protein [Usitatibacter sp.]|jgi:O-antigen/teichoic acid export membrane protein|nr:lipopolysaccharide biosynthesis protein [Usitatibacter sp.]
MTGAQHSLERRALSLGTAYAIEFGLQFLLPVVLTRTLDPHSFGGYRLLWLAIATLLAIAPMCMPESLYYFIPRSEGLRKRLYLNQALIFMVGAAAVSALALSVWDPLLPGSMKDFVTQEGWVVSAFALFWIFSALLDVLPTVDERVGWQAKVIVSLAAIRAISLSLTAFLTHNLRDVLYVLVAFAACKAMLLLWYVVRHYGVGGPWAERQAYKEQMHQAAPFAASGTLHGFRAQGDQWIVAALFTVPQFAAFSVSGVLAPIIQIFRQSVNHVFLPSMSRHEAEGNFNAMLALNSRANSMVGLLVFPMLLFGFAFATPLISLIYTPQYLDAVPVLRVYTIGLLAYVVELTSILFVLKQGPYCAKIMALALAVALPTSYLGALHFGLPGAAMGTVLAVYVERVVSLTRIARLTKVPIVRLQDWATLAGLLAAAGLSAALSSTALRWTGLRPIETLALGGAIMAITYPIALLLTGQRKHLMSFIASIRHAEPEPAPIK